MVLVSRFRIKLRIGFYAQSVQMPPRILEAPVCTPSPPHPALQFSVTRKIHLD